MEQLFYWIPFRPTLEFLNVLRVDHCVKSVRIRSSSGPHFPSFRLNTERYGASHRGIRSISPNSVRMRGYTDLKNSKYGHVLRMYKGERKIIDNFWIKKRKANNSHQYQHTLILILITSKHLETLRRKIKKYRTVFPTKLHGNRYSIFLKHPRNCL